MKAIIPVAGAGARLRPHTYTQPKALIPVGGKPILAYILDELQEAGIQEYIFVIGHLGEKIREYVQEKYPNLHAHYVEQVVRQGIGHAIWLARPYVQKGEPVFIALGDSVFDLSMKELVLAPTSLLCVRKVDDPRSFGVVEMEEKNGMIRQLVEKPQFPKSNLALVGLYKILESDLLFEALNYLIENHITTQGEIQLTDALMRMIEQGVPFKGYKVNNWFDCGKKEQLLETNAILLRKHGAPKHASAKLENTVLIEPVSLGQHVVLSRCIVGPNVSIGEHTRIDGSIISNSIIGSHTDIERVMLENSLVGSDCTLHGVFQHLNLGDDTEIDLR
ncbi:MAG: sugar phosphate nucleotidyltransferase [Chitinophagales bacterium]|nr:sugar phosphate nucleotidyltransferase [Chitinophagales bacterium]MDW8427124.1 sugar phosphate nucleotidyltransferase [Chitinophagales bacterium]